MNATESLVGADVLPSDGSLAPSRPAPRAPEPRREALSGVDPLFVGRWSPRSFRPDAVPREHLRAMLEAARWAPSSANEQPWLFVVASRPEERRRLVEPLFPGNRAWAEKAPVLLYLFARTHRRDGSPYPDAAFDAGAAWMSLALQARLLGLDTHPMGGFDREQAYAATGVDPKEYHVLAAVAVGYRGDPAELPEPLAQRERPSDRRPVSEIVREL